MIATTQTNSSGEVMYDINCNTSYIFQVTNPDYDPASSTVEKVKSGRTSVVIELDPIEVIVTETEVILKNIYFEFNKSNITEQGATELDKLVKVMKDYPTMEILVKSHTDSKGTSAYNLNLSNQRAQSTVQYLISKGIAKERLSGKGLGFTEPKIDCKENCTDEQDAQNRRSEFLIVKK
ncbi:OmpA family protein [Flavobacterium piscinae]|uniref:OmpA family protein n=1 Tax=Flavobacterium piscinae TaxID=2506424 RepID=UPI002AAB3073|nr:OmpA family protein [Flavobacterium piscinae]